MAASRIETFRQMLESDPENTMVRFGLANELLKADRYEEAVGALNDYLAGYSIRYANSERFFIGNNKFNRV